MIYNVTKLYDKYKIEAFKHYLSISKLQIFYSDMLNDFNLNLIESCEEVRKQLVFKVIRIQMSKIPIIELINCPKIDMNNKLTKCR